VGKGGGGEGGEGVGGGGKGKGGIGRGREGKGESRRGREGSTWIFVHGPRVPSYASVRGENDTDQ